MPSAQAHQSQPAEAPATIISNGGASRKSDYRPDIDGLRAIAVLAVVCFHAFPTLLQGGFVGVDIFFVISGFLISKHIWEELASATFSIKTFYARRVRRIFPALAVVLLACLLMGWIILTPGEYEQLGKHVTAGTLFVSNLIFWKEAGYFDNAADTKPLLHLWSLGIEEQFYIVWPLLLAFFWRYSRHFGWILLGLMAASLAYSLMLVGHDAVADFYSPITRFWELAVGAVAAYAVTQRLTNHALHHTLIAWLGLGLIVSAILLVQKEYLFPGAWALLPTLGAVCLIYAGEQAWPNRHLLSLRIMVWFGLISYPLYLWHWPLLSFARIMESGTPSVEIRIGLVIASILLGWLTYRFVERPLRSGPRTRALIWMLCVSIFVVGAAGLIVKKQDGFKSRQFSMLNGESGTMVLGADRAALHHDCGLAETEKSKFQYCLNGGKANPVYGLLGDSKAEALFYGLVRESTPDRQWLMIGSVFPLEFNAAPEDRQQFKNRLALETVINNPSIKIVAIAVALRGIFAVDSDTGFIKTDVTSATGRIEVYSKTIQHLEQAGKHVVFVIDNPTFPDPTSCVSGGVTSSVVLNQVLRRKQNPHCTIRYTDHLAGTQAYREFVGELQRRHPKLLVYDPTPLLCDITNNVCTVTQAGKFLYSYGDHISDYANSMIAKDMLPLIHALVP